MAESVIGATVGPVVAEAYSDLYNVAKDAVRDVVWCKKYCRALAQDLDTHEPIFREIYQHVQMPVREWEQRLLDFKEQLEQGRFLVQSCIQLSGWHPIQRLRLSRAILKLRQQIQQQLQNMAPFNTLLLQQLCSHQQALLLQQDQLRMEAINPLMETMKDTALLLDWVRQANDIGIHEGQTKTQPRRRLDALPVDEVLVGLANPIAKVKSLLFSGEEKMVMIVGGMGGIGKTTLALAVCKDMQVQDFFKDHIYFFTVSQSPNMMGLLSTIWQDIVAEPLPLFQNEEDAYRRLKARLLTMPPNHRLLVFDDVWSKANLENLSFNEVKGCRTLITTRQASTLKTHHSHTYNLGLLSEENAQSLFCHWAFGQDTIPTCVEETLVKEVISECKGLPLALKVIGGSLSSAIRFPMAWQDARDKLRRAESLGEYHKDALQRRLQTSIDALDPKLQECFLDLGAYPEDSESSVETLLDIWVYVHKMEWVDALLALAELGSRCLLDFKSRRPSDENGFMLKYGIASDLVFSQHDVMRDLALYLGRKNCPPSERTRLLMPQKGKSIPMDWQSEEAPLAAQIISISTGAMMEQDWPPMLAFPFAEALLLYVDGDAYQLPPFVQSMRKLKVISIISTKKVNSIVGYLGGLSHLQSIHMEKVALITPATTHTLEKLRIMDVSVQAANKQFSRLESPNLASVVIRGDVYNDMHLYGHLCQLSSLQVLDLCGCRVLELPKELGYLTNLVYLGLRDCNYLKELPASLCKLQCLEVLEIGGAECLQELPENLGQLSALKELYLTHCWFIRELPESFGNLSNLRMLDLNFCSFLGHLPSTFGQLSRLKCLSLEDCSTLRSLPESFGELSCLEYLSLKDGRSMKDLPVSFGQLWRLKQLDLSGAMQLETLPENFGELLCLEVLSLRGCCRLRRLPVRFGQLWRLKQLDLRYAWKLEALPESFGELCCLEVLDLGDCMELKHLPESFGQLSKLRTLEMDEVGLESLPASVMGVGGLVGLESVKCSPGLLRDLWKAVKGENILKPPNLYF